VPQDVRDPPTLDVPDAVILEAQLGTPLVLDLLERQVGRREAVRWESRPFAQLVEVPERLVGKAEREGRLRRVQVDLAEPETNPPDVATHRRRGTLGLLVEVLPHVEAGRRQVVLDAARAVQTGEHATV